MNNFAGGDGSKWILIIIIMIGMIKIDLQLFVGRSEPKIEYFNRPMNEPFNNKPSGGLWSSTYNIEYGSEWIRWCLIEKFNIPYNNMFQCYLLYPKKDARIFVIDKLNDMIDLYNKYGFFYNEISKKIKMINIDFELVSKDYDAIYLSKNGEIETRFNLYDNEYINKNLYGWDCESTLWLDFVFDKVEDIRLKKFELEMIKNG